MPKDRDMPLQQEPEHEQEGNGFETPSYFVQQFGTPLAGMDDRVEFGEMNEVRMPMSLTDIREERLEETEL